MPAGAERAVEHHGDGGLGLGQRLCHHHALAGGKPIGLDHDRRALRAHVSECVVGIVETAIGAGRNVELAAEVFGEALGPLELRRLPARPERLDPGGREIVDDPGRQRRLRADHDQIHRMALAEFDHRRMVGDIERDAFGFPRDAGIARRAPEFGQQRRGRDLPRQRVFAAAGTEQEDVHEMQPNTGLLRYSARV